LGSGCLSRTLRWSVSRSFNPSAVTSVAKVCAFSLLPFSGGVAAELTSRFYTISLRRPRQCCNGGMGLADGRSTVSPSLG
jgi:hypothetical protein